MIDWVYDKLNELVEKGEMTEDEARQEYLDHMKAITEEYMDECLYSDQF